MGLKCGIIGLPNVGKSTLFNALTRSSVPAENYPFCTIDPNVGIVEVPDSRLAPLAEVVAPKVVVPAIVEFVDIAGLVSGASKGEGLGNQFLAHIRETHALIHVVRCFEDTNVVHVAGRVDPLNDAIVIHTELVLADLATVDRVLQREGKKAAAGDRESIRIARLLERVEAHLNKVEPLRTMQLDSVERAMLNPLHLITFKPVMYVANVAEDGFENNPLVEQLTEYAKSQNAPIVTICASIEADIAELDENYRNIFLADMNMEEPGLNRLIRAAYSLLGLRTYFSVGQKEARAWTIRNGDTAPVAAGVIHTDFQRGFIRAQTVSFDDFIAFKGEQGAKEAGKMRAEGKDYVVQDGDVIHFLFNV
jgi:hypothetical protein